MKGTLLHEKDGDFNPGWALFIGFSALGALGSIAAFAVALLNQKAWPAAVAALCFIAFAMLCTAIIVVPLARAKLMAPALTKAAGSIAQTVQPPYPGMDYDERGDDARAD